jgi:transposase
MFYVPAASGMFFQESLGASSTVHDRFQEWRSAGVFRRMWIDGLSVYDKKTGIDWKWQAMDGVITKALVPFSRILLKMIFRLF